MIINVDSLCKECNHTAYSHMSPNSYEHYDFTRETFVEVIELENRCRISLKDNKYIPRCSCARFIFSKNLQYLEQLYDKKRKNK